MHRGLGSTASPGSLSSPSTNTPAGAAAAAASSGVATGNHAMHIRDMVEAFLIRLKRGTYASSSAEKSQTINAALEACAILRTIVEHFADYVRERGGFFGTSPGKKGALALERKFSVGFASSANMSGHFGGAGGMLPPGVKEVQEVITQLTKAGRSLQRASAFRLLLANVARRVLFIVRECAASSTTTMAALESQHISEEEAAQGDAGAEQHVSEGEDRDDDGDVSGQSDVVADDDGDGDFEPAFSAAGGAAGGAARGGLKGKHGTFPATEPRADAAASAARTIFGRPRPSGADARQDSSSADFVGHTPPTDGTLLTRVESTVMTDHYMAGNMAAIPGAAANFGGEIQPIDFNDFVDKTLTGINELETELEKMSTSLCDHAAKQLYNGEVVLTLGCSHTMINFLLTAAKSKTFQVIIIEGAPLGSSEPMVRALERANITTRVLPDSSCWAVMSKASKVFISTNNVLANGGLLAPIGTHPLCLAAKQFSVPVITVTVSLKLCPYYPSDTQCTSLVKISKTEAQEVPWSTFECPLDVLGPHVMHEIDKSLGHELVVDNPITEYVPPHLISLFVTNDGEYTVPQIHRLVRDHYHAEDGHL